jgi:hypothetical protein
MNRRADDHARIVRSWGEHGFDRSEWQADESAGNKDRGRDDGGGPIVESVGTSGGDRLALDAPPHDDIVVVHRVMGPLDHSVMDITMLLGRSGRQAISPG